jgi:hypothetical protein
MPPPIVDISTITITDWIQACSAISMVLLTTALIWMTRKYVAETQRMAEIMTAEFKLRASHCVFLTRKIVSVSKWEKCSIEVQLRNAGTYPVTIEHALLTFWTKDAQFIGAYDIQGLRCTLASNDIYDHRIEIPLNVPKDKQKGDNATGYLVASFQLRIKDQLGKVTDISIGEWQI